MSTCTKLLQITDLHLFNNPQQTLAGLNTNASFTAVLDQIKNNFYHNAELIILTGDLIQDNLTSTYQVLSNKLIDIKLPIYWLPGNHDLESIYQQKQLGNNMFNNKIIELADWRIILLNSVAWGRIPGLFSIAEQDFLKQALSLQPNKHVLIAIHHPPVNLPGDNWLNSVGLTNIADFWQVIADSKNNLGYSPIKVIIAGHVHQELCLNNQNILILTTPSTSIQFSANANKFALDPESPGYRYLELYADGNIVTQVYRVTDFPLTLDLNSTGY